MLIFNTTYLVRDKVYGIWYKWLYEVHIPMMLDSGFFDSPQVAKIISTESEEATSSYSVQFRIADMASLKNWNNIHGESFANHATKHFGEDVLFFSTIMEIME